MYIYKAQTGENSPQSNCTSSGEPIIEIKNSMIKNNIKHASQYLSILLELSGIIESQYEKLDKTRLQNCLKHFLKIGMLTNFSSHGVKYSES